MLCVSFRLRQEVAFNNERYVVSIHHLIYQNLISYINLTIVQKAMINTI